MTSYDMLLCYIPMTDDMSVCGKESRAIQGASRRMTEDDKHFRCDEQREEKQAERLPAEQPIIREGVLPTRHITFQPLI